uniref:Disease resistance protein At4g11170 family n=1 Tax=Cajanus cajan TaxID=3821 RepID=A0A151QP50_CAJCA|nr:Putative disease resistance protein At4g11170 family [Cajanus cajan]
MVSSKKYEVFLSFRGEDTRMNFTSHLHEALKKKEVETFIDYELRKGDEISPALIQAIENSLVSIVILSPNYASSKWYPSQVRKQTGSYEQAFAKYKGESNYNKWKTALNEIANLVGWEPQNRTEPELLKEIVGEDLRKLTPSYRNQLKGLVGIEDSCEEIESVLKIGSTEVITIGIWGIPLALKVLGASLRRRSEEVWESELRKLQKIPNMQIHNILKLSYDGLDRSFLDIACLLKGERRDWVTSLLEACGFFAVSGIEVLLDKALMIQQMGQEIVHQESIKDLGRQSRLWKHDEVCEVLKYNKGTDDVEGIILNLDALTEDLCLSSDTLAKMANVRFLKIHKVRYWDEYKFNLYLPHGLKSLSNKLRYLRWDGFCLESLSSNFCAEQLVELHISLSKVKRLWDGVQDLSNLKTIRLHDLPELIEIPDLSMARKLEHISLLDCISLCELHPSIVSLPNLKIMGLFRCSKIEILKVHSKCLRILVAYDCSSLKEFSITSKEMVCLNLRKTTISALPSSIWNNGKFSDLHLTVSNNLESLIANIQNLSLLKLLYLLNCQKFVSLPQLPPSLRELHLSDLRELVSLPQLPSSLRVLHLSDLRELVSLPQLPSSLRELHLSDLRELVSLPQLPSSLRVLHLSDLRELVSLPQLPSSLRVLHLSYLKELMSLPQLPPSVTYVRAINCTFLGTDFTQRIELQHMLSHSLSIDCETCFMFSGDHVTDKCKFQKAGTSITIPYLPPSNLCGFICSLVLYRGSYGGFVSCSIYQDDEEDFDYYYSVPKNLTSDHILFQYFKPEDLSNDVPFKFEFHFYDRDSDKDYGQERIKECGVFPVYAPSIEIGVGASNGIHFSNQ